MSNPMQSAIKRSAYTSGSWMVVLRKELHIETLEARGTPMPPQRPVTWLAQLSPPHAAAN